MTAGPDGTTPPTTPDDATALDVARRAAEAAGQVLRRLRGTDSADPGLKHGYEVVTAADLAADEVIREVITSYFPAHRVISEETWTGWRDGLFDGPVWVVDPLDGSVNYSRGHPYVSVSVAYAVDGEVRAGVVLAPFVGETYQAARGSGAWCNGARIQVASTERLAEALVGTGFPHRRDDVGPAVERVRRLVTHCRDIRRAASPALDICRVAAGVLDAHTEDLFPWDVAAAALVATEAGARRGTLTPQPFPVPADLAAAGFLVAAPGVYQALADLLGDLEFGDVRPAEWSERR